MCTVSRQTGYCYNCYIKLARNLYTEIFTFAHISACFVPVGWDATLALHIKAYAYGIKYMALAVSQAEAKAGKPATPTEQPDPKPSQYAIVNMSSTCGLRGTPELVRYGTAKAGILGMTRSCAFDLGNLNIRCGTASQSCVGMASKKKSVGIRSTPFLLVR